MDSFSIFSAMTAWRNAFSQPAVLMDDDLRALYEYKRGLEQAPPAPILGPIRAEIAEGAGHFREALRLVFRRLAMH